LELEAGTRLIRLNTELDTSELARTTRLLLVGVIVFHSLGDRLAVGHLRRTDIGFHLELALHAIDDDVEMKLAHAGDDGLARFLVGLDPEARILGRETL